MTVLPASAPDKRTARRHYLDYNATCPVRPEVIAAVADTMAEVGNSSSVHGEGRAARAHVEAAREKVRALSNAPVNGVVFTSGGTEAIHLAMHGLVATGRIRRIYVSAIEHAAVMEAAISSGLETITVPALPTGTIDLNWLADALRTDDSKGEFLLCLMMANNETGVIQPVREAADLVHQNDGLVFVDAAQALGKIPVNFVMSGADMMAVTAHKFGGPIGIGALIAAPNLPFEPQLKGGGHEQNRRAGTHNVPGIVGMGVACQSAAQAVTQHGAIAAMRNRMEIAAREAGATIWGGEAERLPGTVCVSAPGFSSETQLMAMDLAGIAVSSGSACSSGKTKASHVLRAMGADDPHAHSALRVSIGWGTSSDDVEAFCREWPAAYLRIKAKQGAAA